MKKQKEEKIIEYFERNVVLIALNLAVTAVLAYIVYKFISDVNPWGFIVGVPAVILVFHTLWILLNPYAIIFEDKIEIKNSMFRNKTWYLIDIKKVNELKKGNFSIVYNDDDEEVISITGIRSSQSQKFRDAFNHYVCKSLVERDD